MEMQKSPKHSVTERGQWERRTESEAGVPSLAEPTSEKHGPRTEDAACRFGKLSLKIWRLDLCSSPCSAPSWPQFLQQEDGVILIMPSPGSQESR